MHYSLRAHARLSLHTNLRRRNAARTLNPGTRYPDPFVLGVTSRRRPAQSERGIRAFHSAGARDALKPQGGIYPAEERNENPEKEGALPSSQGALGVVYFLSPHPNAPACRPKGGNPTHLLEFAGPSRS